MKSLLFAPKHASQASRTVLSVGRSVRRIAAPLAACLSLTLMAPEALAYRTAGDLPEFEGTERVRWEDEHLAFVLQDSFPDSLGNAALVQWAAEAGASGWNAASCSTVSIAFPSISAAEAVSGDNSNTISWVTSGWELQGGAPDAAAFTRVEYGESEDGWAIVEADILLNAESFSWSVDGASGTQDLRVVLAHELGHALGLLHPCEHEELDGVPLCGSQHESALMNPIYESGVLELGDDDRKGVCWLYPDENCPDGDCPASPSCEGDDDCPAPECVPDCEGAEDCLECEVPAEAWPPGDPCEAPSDCDTENCLSSGFCAAECADAGACGGSECSAGICSDDPRGGLGERCAAASDCIAGVCLASAGASKGECSRACDEGNPCPSEWTCSEVEEQQVCVPQQEKDSMPSGCALVPVGPGGSRSPLILFAIVFLAAALHRCGRMFPQLRNRS